MPQTGPLSSTIGRKIVMAVTGVVLVGFVIAHMSGNLLLFVGPAALNEYAAWLRSLLHGAGLWIMRGTLVVAVVLHAWSAWTLTQDGHAARPVKYANGLAPDASTYASRTMRWGGVILVAFIGYHLMHMTIGNVHPSFVEGDVYHNMITGFRVWPVTVFYVIAMVLLGLHLRHGVWSMFHTLGVSHPRYRAFFNRAALVVALVVMFGFISGPVAVLLGLVR
jgi:succinate dehydrogenase / fumarate reductase cytochrome b subunit